MSNQEEPKFISLEDSQGIEMIFEVIAEVENKGKRYLVLIEQTEVGESDEYTILESLPDNSLVGISSNDELNEVYRKFCAEFDESTTQTEN